MVETIGKKLSQARLARGLSIEEAAHETRVRPDKLIALENDDYSRFGSNAYAKGFLQIYGRFLDVDVADTARHMETPRSVTISDYQYLNNAPEPEVRRIQIRRNSGSNRPSVMPLIVMMALMLAGAGVYIVFLVNETTRRIETTGTTTTPSTTETAAAGTSPQPAPPAANLATQTGEAPQPRVTEPQIAPATTTPSATPGEVEVRRAEAVNASASLTGTAPQIVAPAAGLNEIVLEPIKTTWVKVQRDGPDTVPMFEGYIYRGAAPLKLRGTKFYVEVREQDAVQIRKNGNPIAYQAPGISIQ
jgi:cytoskeletal protein RodZ